MDSWVLYVLGALWLRGLLSYPKHPLSYPRHLLSGDDAS